MGPHCTSSETQLDNDLSKVAQHGKNVGSDQHPESVTSKLHVHPMLPQRCLTGCGQHDFALYNSVH